MTHKQWIAMQTRAMTLATSRPAAAARQLERLARAVESGSRSTVGDWHFEQTLSLASIVRSEAHEHRQSADTLARLVEHHEAILRYQQRALVSALASQALELAAIDDRAGAAQALRRAAPWAKNLRPAERLFELARKAAKRTARRKRATG